VGEGAKGLGIWRVDGRQISVVGGWQRSARSPGRPGAFSFLLASQFALASNGSSLEQGRFRVVDWSMSCGVRINGRGSNGGVRTLEPTPNTF
jgi:hypothetical protein